MHNFVQLLLVCMRDPISVCLEAVLTAPFGISPMVSMRGACPRCNAVLTACLHIQWPYVPGLGFMSMALCLPDQTATIKGSKAQRLQGILLRAKHDATKMCTKTL